MVRNLFAYYCADLLIFFVLFDFAMIREGETETGLMLLFFQGGTMFSLGAGLVRVLSAGRKKRAA